MNRLIGGGCRGCRLQYYSAKGGTQCPLDGVGWLHVALLRVENDLAGNVVVG